MSQEKGTCRVRGGKVHKGNEARSNRQASIKFEKQGVMVSRPKGHKKAGWVQFPSLNWKPAALRGAK